MPDLDLLATQSRLVIRKSPKFTPAAFLQSLLGSVATGLASLNQLAAGLGERAGLAMARQSLHERFDIRSTNFLMSVLCELTRQRFEPAAAAMREGTVRREERGQGRKRSGDDSCNWLPAA